MKIHTDGQWMDKILNARRSFFTSNLHVGSFHLAGRHCTAGVAVGADLLGEAPADRQVVDVLVVPDSVVSTLQGTQVELVAAHGVANPAVVACDHTVKTDCSWK